MTTPESAPEPQAPNIEWGKTFERIPSEQCIEGHYYFGVGRSISNVAICIGRTQFGIEFKGWRNKLGEDFLFSEVHYDDNESVGTYSPEIDMGPAPHFSSDDECMSWILELEISIKKSLLNWIKSQPQEYLQTEDAQIDIQRYEGHLQELLDTKQNGFSHERISFRSILEKKRSAQGQ